MTAMWRILLGPMVIWSAHFFALWTASSVWPDRPAARIAAALATLAALAALAWLTVRTWRSDTGGPDAGWIRRVGLLACAVAAVSILWQSLPAAIG